jgi:hypothetical protein
MVTGRISLDESSTSCVPVSSHPALLPVEELEERLEIALMQMIHSDPCNCLGALCQCDGQDCVEVCATYCLIHYV